MSDWVLVAGDPARVAKAALALADRSLELHAKDSSLVALARDPHTAHVEHTGTRESDALAVAYSCAPSRAALFESALTDDGLTHDEHGAYAFARWHYGRAELHAERDALGRIPLVYGFDARNETCACGTDPALVLRALGLSARPDEGALLAHLDALGTLSDAEMLAPLRRVRAGESLRWAPGAAPRVARHWSPTLRQDLANRDAVDAVRSTLASVVREHSAHTPPVVSISGGLDSTVLAAALAEEFGASPEHPVAAASMVARELPCFDESGALALLERTTPVRIERFEIGPYWPLREPDFYTQSALDGPHTHPGTYYEAAYYRWFSARFGERPLWLGLGSEQAFSDGSAQSLRGMLRREGLASAWRESRSFSTPSNLARALAQHTLGWGDSRFGDLARTVRRAQSLFAPRREGELTRWLTPRARARLASLRGAATDELDPAEPPAVRTQRGALNELIFRRLRRQALETRVAITSPLLDPRVWELGFRIAPEWKLRGGHDRAVLRLAAPASLPDELRWRPKRGLFTSAVERGLFRRELERVLQWFRAPRLADLGLIEPRAFRLAYEDAARAVDATWPVLYSAHSRDLWLAVSAELWLRALP